MTKKKEKNLITNIRSATKSLQPYLHRFVMFIDVETSFFAFSLTYTHYTSFKWKITKLIYLSLAISMCLLPYKLTMLYSVFFLINLIEFGYCFYPSLKSLKINHNTYSIGWTDKKQNPLNSSFQCLFFLPNSQKQIIHL